MAERESRDNTNGTEDLKERLDSSSGDKSCEEWHVVGEGGGGCPGKHIQHGESSRCLLPRWK